MFSRCVTVGCASAPYVGRSAYAGLLRVHAIVLSSPLHALVAGGLVVRDATPQR